jgi:hypothetical protein
MHSALALCDQLVIFALLCYRRLSFLNIVFLSYCVVVALLVLREAYVLGLREKRIVEDNHPRNPFAFFDHCNCPINS